MKHFLAFGNADQESFRSEAVRQAIDYMTVPGTIATYYPEATAGFVLSSGYEYVIDPRTPLFQGSIDQPRASHFTLAAAYGNEFAELLGDEADRGPRSFSLDSLSSNVLHQMTSAIVDYQRHYGSRATAPKVTAAFAKYEAILAAAGRGPIAEDRRARPPAFVLAPYFCASNIEDEWAVINRRIWEYCLRLDDPVSISPVVAIETTQQLGAALRAIPEGLSPFVFFWVPSFVERRVLLPTLMDMRHIVEETPRERQLINLYGGFFSICLSKSGLAGFNNGLGYSESRDWPELSATGAAPARYYIPRLHAFATPALAELVMRLEPRLRCPCAICTRASDRLVGLSYAALKQHFAYARRSELDFVEASTRGVISDDLRQAFGLFESVRERLPRGAGTIHTGYLLRWADAVIG